MKQYKYKLVETKKFRKELLKVKARKSFLKDNYEYVIEKLLNGEELPPKDCNHLLEPKSQRVL